MNNRYRRMNPVQRHRNTFNKIIVENFCKEFKDRDVLQEVYITQKQKGPKRTLSKRLNNQIIKGRG